MSIKKDTCKGFTTGNTKHLSRFDVPLVNTTFTFSWVNMLSKIKERREHTDGGRPRGGGKEIKVGDYRSAAGLGAMGWREGQSRGEEIDLLPSMMCFLLRPRSVSALQQDGESCMSGAPTTHAERNTIIRKRTSLRNWSRSLNMPNKSLHNKLPTNHWRAVHPLEAPQCACSYGTNCAVCLQWTNTRLIVIVCPVYYLTMTSWLVKIYRGENWRITRLNMKPSNSDLYFYLERNVSLLTSLHLPSIHLKSSFYGKWCLFIHPADTEQH